MPDNDCSTTAVVRYKPVHTITPPAGVGQGTWSAAIYVLPHISSLSLVRKWADATPTTVETQVVQNDRLSYYINGTDWRFLVLEMRCIARSATVRLNAPALSNQGRVYACQLRPSNVVQSASETTTTGRVNCLQLAKEITTGGDVVEASAKAYQDEAKRGSYTPCGFAQPTNLFRATTDLTTETGEGARSPTRWYLALTMSTNAEVPGVYTADLGRGPMFADMCMGFHLYTGLSASATLELTNRLVFEAIPSSMSPWVPFQSPGAVPDPMAIDNYFVIRHSMPDAYGEEANFLGALASLAGSVLPALASWAVPRVLAWLGDKAKPAAVEAAAPAAGKAVAVPSPQQPKGRKSRSRSRRKARSASTPAH